MRRPLRQSRACVECGKDWPCPTAQQRTGITIPAAQRARHRVAFLPELPAHLDLGGRTYRCLRAVASGAVLQDHEGATYVLEWDATDGMPSLCLDPARLRRLG